MPHDVIKDYIVQLRQKLPYVPPVPTATLEALHQGQDYTGLVRQIKRFMNIEGVTVRVEQVPDGAANDEARKNAPAWIKLPDKFTMPFYGTKAFREMTLTMCIRKPFLQQSTYDQAAVVIAHELSHVVLDSIAHPLCREERAVDLTAMLLGFRLLYKTGCYKEQRFGNKISSLKIGYLSSEEIDFINDLLSNTGNGDRLGSPSRWKLPLSLESIIAPNPVVLISVLVALVIVILPYRTWEPHETPATKQAQSPPSPSSAPPADPAPRGPQGRTDDDPRARIPQPRQEVDYATVQRRLIDLGYLIGPADGIWGPKSRLALRTFKVANGLPANEEWDDITAARLFSPRPARAPMPLSPSAKAQ
jgi:hypothetical protein